MGNFRNDKTLWTIRSTQRILIKKIKTQKREQNKNLSLNV